MKDIVAEQRKYFASNATKSIDFRIDQLQCLKRAIREREPMLQYTPEKKQALESLIASHHRS